MALIKNNAKIAAQIAVELANPNLGQRLHVVKQPETNYTPDSTDNVPVSNWIKTAARMVMIVLCIAVTDRFLLNWFFKIWLKISTNKIFLNKTKYCFNS